MEDRSHSGPLDEAGLSSALGAIPSGLFVVTTGPGGRGTGFLASFVQQVGFEPPALTVAVRSDQVAEMVRASGGFCVNVLEKNDRLHLVRFAKGPPDVGDAFEGLEIVPTPVLGLPALVGTLAQIECRLLGEVSEWTDHIVFCGHATNGVRAEDAERTSAVHLRKNGFAY
jgi:3-hydroxy-9,10-secoandrosta-1,3,5(10)-triene-9,17-dione monooxygenase reductase component